jgi:hypothetical protein
MKEKFGKFCQENIIFTMALVLLLFVVGVKLLFVGMESVIAMAKYPVADSTSIFSTSSNQYYLISDEEGEFILRNVEGDVLYRSRNVVNIIPGDTVIFYEADGSVVEINPEMPIEEEGQVVNVAYVE